MKLLFISLLSVFAFAQSSQASCFVTRYGAYIEQVGSIKLWPEYVSVVCIYKVDEDSHKIVFRDVYRKVVASFHAVRIPQDYDSAGTSYLSNSVSYQGEVLKIPAIKFQLTELSDTFTLNYGSGTRSHHFIRRCEYEK